MFKLPKLSLGARPEPRLDQRNEMALWFALGVYTL